MEISEGVLGGSNILVGNGASVLVEGEYQINWGVGRAFYFPLPNIGVEFGVGALWGVPGAG